MPPEGGVGEAEAAAIRLATLPEGGPTGSLFEDEGVVPWWPRIRQSLANAYAQAGQLNRAVETAAAVVADSRQLHGEGHHLTLGRRADRAEILSSAGLVDQAITEYEALLSDLPPDYAESHVRVGARRPSVGGPQRLTMGQVRALSAAAERRGGGR
ncbi:hypothetical protein [Streptacidiphilus sp. MAP12-16]|uniref:hypothetical protein n=1 Tax=Streptacidiphilus sp. MAP12-16 TaxID=3156300 RepID=UPI00351755DB